LKKRGHQVTAILTKSACQLVTPHTFQNLTGQRVLVEMFDVENAQTEHIALTDKAALAIVAPATANVIAKMAVGIADDVLTTTLLAVACPVLVCPAMNTRMWNHVTVQKNLATLKAQGMHVLEPDAGLLACGHVGPGRLAEPEAIEREVERLLAGGPLPPPEGRAGVGGARYFLERLTVPDAPTAIHQAEARYRAELTRAGHVTGSGPVGMGDRDVLHVHRAATLDEVRRRVESSPLVVGVVLAPVGGWRRLHFLRVGTGCPVSSGGTGASGRARGRSRCSDQDLQDRHVSRIDT
jgi:hypothetical protein